MYEDVYCSSTVLEAAKWGDLTSDDTLLMLSIDGAQLFESKPVKIPSMVGPTWRWEVLISY